MIVYRCRYCNKVFYNKEEAFNFVENYYNLKYPDNKGCKVTFTEKENKRIYKIKLITRVDYLSEHQLTVTWEEVEE